MAAPKASLYKDATMLCLFCGQEQLSPKDKIDNWTCTHCFSGLISYRMLVNLIPRKLYDQIMQSKSPRDKSRPCPSCKQGVRQAVATHGDQSVTLELCHQCKFCWFEGGAIVKLARLGGSQGVMLPDAPKLGVRAPQKKNIPQIKKERPFPVMAFFLFGLFSIFSALALHYSFVTEEWGFQPLDPFREFGATWFSSLAINDAGQIPYLLFFLLAGVFCERQLGWRSFFSLCIVAGLASRITGLFGPKITEPIVGSIPICFALVVYCLFMIPYRDFLFPEERWKSPMGMLSWLGIFALLFFAVFILGDFATQVLSPEFDSSKLVFNIPVWGAVSFSYAQLPYLVAALVGGLWNLASSSH